MNAFTQFPRVGRSGLRFFAAVPLAIATLLFASTTAFRHRLQRLSLRLGTRTRMNAPIVMLVALLQRTPIDRVVAVSDEIVVASPVGAVLRATALAAATLGSLHSLAGATTLLATQASPFSATVGGNVSIGFTVTNTINIGSWKVMGTLPPGTVLSANEGGNMLTGPGTLDATSPGTSNGYGGTTGANATTTPVLTGSPTTAGSYTFSLQAYEFGKLGGLVSDTFQYTINVANPGPSTTAPTISDPVSQSVTTGSSVTFSVTVTGTPSPGVQWQKDGTSINGATSTTLTLASVQSSDAGTYAAVATNSAGTATSHGATLTVTVPNSAPAFTVQPTSQTIATGNSVAFNATATATGAGAITYRWQHDGVDLAGATGALLLVSNPTAVDTGTYTVIATNPTGSTTSSPATLTVVNVSAADTGHLSNLSVRTHSGTGAQVLNVGFTVGGASTSGTKPLLVRVVGPTLGAIGVAGSMADPTLTIQPLGSTAVVASNDNWNGDTTVIQTGAAVGAFGLSDTASADAAVVTSLGGGTYSAIAAGKNNGEGIVLTEIYDATSSASFTTTTPRLINVSARAQVGTGDGVLIAGFAISGATSKTLLIRAIGPTLGSFGVAGTLADPALQINPLNGPKLYENDNWGGASVLTNVAKSVYAFDLSDAQSKDSVLLVTLPPGVYTAEVKGADNGTGIALVELYEVP